MSFTIGGYLAAMPELAVAHLHDRKSARVGLTRTRPLLFAMVYLRHHLKVSGELSFSPFHLAAEEAARAWVEPPSEPGSARDAWIAPRNIGKSTWFYLVLPMWAAAHGHKRFVAAFSHSGPQAQQHLSTFRAELDTNELLQADFPDLCKPKKRRGGAVVADRSDAITMRNGFSFVARGIDGGVLGMKIDDARPDLIILDDIEPDEASYSLYQVGKRRGTLIDAVLPLNIMAHVVLVGTTTIAGGIVHQLIQHELGEDAEEPQEWIDDEKFKIHYFPAISIDDDGNECSVWPEKWSMEYLGSIRHTRSYAKNMDNKPVAVNGAYWGPEDFHPTDPETIVTRRILSLDPSVTSKDSSDFIGVAVLGLVPPVFSEPNAAGKRRLIVPRSIVVEKTRSVRLVIGDPLRRMVMAELESDPSIKAVLVETNQGGDLWLSVLHDLPVRLLTVHQTEPKEVRAAGLLAHCQTGRVSFRGRQRAFETEALGFPNGVHDDVIDAVGSGVFRLLDLPRRTTKMATGKTISYAG